jgi:hypothetical protein
LWHRHLAGAFTGWKPVPHGATGSLGMAKQSLIKEFFLFIKQEKKWWLVPLIAVLLLVGALIVFASSSPLAPFIYPLF